MLSISGTPIDRRRARIELVLAIVAFLALGIVFVPSAGWDDAYITYWSAHSLAETGRLVNYNGQFVEQSSTLGFVLIIALFKWLTDIDASVIGRLASVFFGALSIAATASLGRLAGATIGRLAPVIVASSPFYIYWSFGGMEATLTALCGTLLLLLLSRALIRGLDATLLVSLVAAVAAYILARPEALLIVVALAAGLWLMEILRQWKSGASAWWTAPVRLLAIATGIALAVAAAVSTLRFWMFDRLMPEPAYAKSKLLSKQKVFDGLGYLAESLSSEFAVLLLMAAIASVLIAYSRIARPRDLDVEALCAAFVAANIGFIVFSGGDGMHAGRFFVPAIPAAAVLATGLLSRALPGRRLSLAALVWVALQAGGLLLFARDSSYSDPIWAVHPVAEPAHRRFHWFERANRDHRRYFPAVVELERQIDLVLARKRPVTVFSGQSGFVMYHVARSRPDAIRYVDRFGLVTRDFIECPISRNAPRTVWGLLITVPNYLRLRDEFRRQCGIPMPDLIYEIYWSDFPRDIASALDKAGYTIVFRQEDDTLGGSAVLPGHPAFGRVFIARTANPGADQ